MLLLQSIYGHPVTSSMARPCVLQHELFGSDNHFGLGFCVFIAGWRKKRAKGFIFFSPPWLFWTWVVSQNKPEFSRSKSPSWAGFRVLSRFSISSWAFKPKHWYHGIVNHGNYMCYKCAFFQNLFKKPNSPLTGEVAEQSARISDNTYNLFVINQNKKSVW